MQLGYALSASSTIYPESANLITNSAEAGVDKQLASLAVVRAFSPTPNNPLKKSLNAV